MDHRRPFERARTMDTPRPRLISCPENWTEADAREWMGDVDQTWSALARYGRERLHDGGWRQLGVGAVHHASDLFQRLAAPLCVAWSTLDAHDGWNQTVVQIALRQRCWFTPNTQPYLGMLARSRFDLYQVVRHAPGQLVLERATDRRRFEVHATFDDGAYPRGAYIVARLIRDHVSCAAIASAVVTAREIRQATRHGLPSSRFGWSQLLLDLALDRFSRVTARARHDVVDDVYVAPGPDRTRRLHQAFTAIEAGMKQRNSELFEFSGRGCKVFVEDTTHGTCVVYVTRSGIRIGLRRLPGATFSNADREIARQAGLSPADGLLQGAAQFSTSNWSFALDALARTARRLHGPVARRAA